MAVIYMSGDSGGDWRVEGGPESIMITKLFVMAQLITALSTLLNQPPAADKTTAAHVALGLMRVILGDQLSSRLEIVGVKRIKRATPFNRRGDG